MIDLVVSGSGLFPDRRKCRPTTGRTIQPEVPSLLTHLPPKSLFLRTSCFPSFPRAKSRRPRRHVDGDQKSEHTEGSTVYRPGGGCDNTKYVLVFRKASRGADRGECSVTGLDPGRVDGPTGPHRPGFDSRQPSSFSLRTTRPSDNRFGRYRCRRDSKSPVLVL